MKKNKQIALLNAGYDYYSKVKEKSDKISKFYFKGDEIKKAELYNLVLNLINQVIYDYTYTFTERDLDFIIENGININSLLEEFVDDIKNIKGENEKYSVKRW